MNKDEVELPDAFEQALLALDRVAAQRLFEKAASGPDALRLVGDGLNRIGAVLEHGTTTRWSSISSARWQRSRARARL